MIDACILSGYGFNDVDGVPRRHDQHSCNHICRYILIIKLMQYVGCRRFYLLIPVI